jgi:hypothetical protein
VARAATVDSATLHGEGYDVKWLRREPALYAAVVSKGADATRLEWLVDSDFRFFPTQRDDNFGYVLHPVDLATNKFTAAAGRREPRDVVDLLTVHDRVLPLGAVAWAAVGKSLGFTPEGLIDEVRRARYTEADFRHLASDPPVDASATMTRLRQVLHEAAAFVARMPTNRAGLLFLEAGGVVQPDPERLDSYQTHAGQRRGHWPGSPEIGAAMLEQWREKRER